MKEIAFCFTVDDVAYDGYSSEEHLAKYLDFSNEQGMKATLFTVPLYDDKDFQERSGYVKILKEAISEGHEVAQHGLRHDRFETGIPPEFILALPHEAPIRGRVARERAAIEAANSVDAIRERLALGRTILEDALEHKIRGFRGGAGSSCANLYIAEEKEGYTWDSTRIIQEAGWDLIQGILDISPNPIMRERFDGLQPSGALKELPLTTDYTWYLTKDKYEASLNLAKSDFVSCLEARIPFVPVCHISPIIESENNCGYELYRELIKFAKDVAAERGVGLSFPTMSDACSNYWNQEKSK
ncbi:MAG: DUF2334 domain-containing protein [Armatimonadota bacterium]